MTDVPEQHGATPQWRKLGLKDGLRLAVVGAPERWQLESDDDFPLVARVESGAADIIVGFARDQASVVDLLETQRERIRPHGALWIAWPRKAAGHLSDVSDETVRAVALDLGMVDVKVAALDHDWSALKLVWRVEHR